MRIAVVSDTHMPSAASRLPDACRERLAAADLIVHAGDWSDAATLADVRAIGPPVVGVHGNVEEVAVRAALPATAEVEAAGRRIGVVHNGGPQAGRLERMRRRFPGAAGVVFGHSHIPMLGVADDGFFILNPGSPTDRRRQPRHTMAEITLREGEPPRFAFWAVDAPEGELPAELVRDGRG